MLQIKSSNAEIGTIYLREYDELKVVSRGSSDRIYIKFIQSTNSDELNVNFYRVFRQMSNIHRQKGTFTFTFTVGYYDNGFQPVREYTNCWVSETEFSRKINEPAIFEMTITTRDIGPVAAETISANMVATVTKGKGE